MSKFVTLVLEPRFNDEYGEYANLPVFNAHGDVIGYTGGEVPETGNPCEFYVMDEEGFPVCHSASENAKLLEELEAAKHDLSVFSGELVASKFENAKLRELRELRDYVTPIAWYAASEQERDRMRELGVEVDG